MELEKFKRMIEEQEEALPKRVIITRNVVKTEENFGLEKYDLVLFPGCKRIEMLGYTNQYGVIRYLTGLDELLVDKMEHLTYDQKEAKKKFIRREVAYLEFKLVNNVLDPDDIDFWSKVKLLSPTNDDYWSKMTIELDNYDIVLNLRDPADRIKYHCIIGGGFCSVAPNYEVASINYKRYKWYLDNPVEETETRIKYKIFKNNAIKYLTEIYENNDKNKLFAIVKGMSKNSASLKRSEISLDKLYDIVDGWFYGNLTTCLYDDVRTCYEIFITLAKNNNLHYLNTYAFVVDLINMSNLSYNNTQNKYYSSDLNEFLGKNIDECAKYLTSEVGKRSLMRLIELYGKQYDYLYFESSSVEDHKKPNDDNLKVEESVTQSSSRPKLKMK